MSPFLEQKELFDQVLRLGKGEQRDPYAVIERFFGDYRLHECRHYLWTMVETCLTTDNVEFSDPDERANLLLRYRELERLVEAGYLLLLQHDPARGSNAAGGSRTGAQARRVPPVRREGAPTVRRRGGPEAPEKGKAGADPPGEGQP